MQQDDFFEELSPTKKSDIITQIASFFEVAYEIAHQEDECVSYSEDVKLYLSHLLYVSSMPSYKSVVNPYISLRKRDVILLVDMAQDLYLKYFIYKVNADNILVHVGVLKDVLYEEDPDKLRTELNEYIETAQLFYEKAAEYNTEIYRRTTAISKVFGALSKDAFSYVRILSHLRKDYFLFLNTFQDDVFSQFLDSMKLYEDERELEYKKNSFLDVYTVWKKRKTKDLEDQLRVLSDEIHALDPSFTFSLDEE